MGRLAGFSCEEIARSQPKDTSRSRPYGLRLESFAQTRTLLPRQCGNGLFSPGIQSIPSLRTAPSELYLTRAPSTADATCKSILRESRSRPARIPVLEVPLASGSLDDVRP